MEQKKILIVDDDAVVLRTMKDGLSEKYKVYGANSGPNALKILGKIPMDLVLLDYEMPEMNGPQVLDAIRADETLKDTPVMFLTGVEGFCAGDHGLDIAGCMQKSLPLAEIAANLEDFFDGN